MPTPASRWQHASVMLLSFSVAYCVSYVLGAALYLEPALVSALWPGNGLALGVLLLVARRWWPFVLGLQGLLHLVLGIIDISVAFGIGVTVANLVETVIAATLIRRWCGGAVRLEDPAHIAHMLAGAVVGVVPGAVIGALTVYGVYGIDDLLGTARSWLLSDLIGILVLTPAIIAFRTLGKEMRSIRPAELVLALVLLVVVTLAVCFHPAEVGDSFLRPSLLWIPLLWLGIRSGPSLTAVAACVVALLLVTGADLDRGPFVERDRPQSEVALAAQVFIAIFCTGTLLIAASSAAYRSATTTARGNVERLRITLASIGDGVIATDAQGRVELLNPVASELTGWSDREAVGRPLHEVFITVRTQTGESTRNPVERVLQEGRRVEVDEHTELIHRDGTSRRIADSASPIRDTTGAVVGAVLVFRDTSERHRMEELLHQTEKMEAIGRLSSGIAHDLNNMLGGVMGGADLLQSRIGSDERLLKPVRMILSAAERMHELNARLLSFARREPAARRVLAVDRLVEDCAELLRHGLDHRYRLEIVCNAGRVQVSVDRAQFQSALLNLAVNARDAMPHGGVLHIETSLGRRDEREVVFIAVRDHGTGMTPEVRARVCEPFFTTKPSGLGTGLGLHAVQTCMHAHDGDIEIDSAPGAGTTVTLILPQAAGLAPDTPEPITAPLRVLLVDDDPAVRGTTGAQLEDLGFGVTLAEDGVAGLAALEERGPFDVVVLDVVMPRMDGLEMLRHLRKTHAELAVLLVSGRLPDVDLQDLLVLGPTVLLAKPYRLTDLRRALDEVRAAKK